MITSLEKLEMSNKLFIKFKNKYKALSFGYGNKLLINKISNDIEKMIEEYYLIDIFDFEKIKIRIIKNLKLIPQIQDLVFGSIDKLYYSDELLYDLEKIISMLKQIYYPAYMNLYNKSKYTYEINKIKFIHKSISNDNFNNFDNIQISENINETEKIADIEDIEDIGDLFIKDKINYINKDINSKIEKTENKKNNFFLDKKYLKKKVIHDSIDWNKSYISI